MNYLIEDAEAPLREALERLAEKDERCRPFVKVSHVGHAETFVRFVVKRRKLYFDIRHAGREKLDAVGPPHCAAVFGLVALTIIFDVPHDARVLITEDDERPKRRHSKLSDFWEKVFA